MTLQITPRTSWQSPANPVTGPAPLLAKVKLIPAHYTAANQIPKDVPAYLRKTQADYTSSRGYSIGYNFAIDQLALCYELRGFDIRCAANKGMNEVTIAVLCLVNGQDAMNPQMTRTFQLLAAEIERRIRAAASIPALDLLTVGHRDIGATQCPGTGVYGQVQAGILEPNPNPAPPPSVTPGKGVRQMYTYSVTRQGWPGPVDLTISADGVRWNANGFTSATDKLAGTPRIDNGDKPTLLNILVDRQGLGPHPFASGDYADADITRAWES